MTIVKLQDNTWHTVLRIRVSSSGKRWYDIGNRWVCTPMVIEVK